MSHGNLGWRGGKEVVELSGWWSIISRVEQAELGGDRENHLHLVFLVVLIEMILPLPSTLLILIAVGGGLWVLC